MKFSASWLGDFTDLSAAGGLDGVARHLEQAGFPVEGIERSGPDGILDVEITPNRPDAMNHRGLAREISAIGAVPGRTPEAAPLPGGGPGASELASVEIAVPALCRRFGARVIEGISEAPAGPAVRSRLSALGAKSISAPVDATNYALWDLGQPLHAFDLDRLAGRRIVVRKARRGEKLVTLDGIERTLQPSDIVVADAERAVSLAGIMGGLDTAVRPDTRNVLLEAAWWDPASIRKTSRRLGMHTDASHRFERGADPEAIPEALDLAARLVLESAGGRLASGRIDARGKPFKRRTVPLRLSRLRLLAGDERLDLEFAAEALRRLGFVPERKGKRFSVAVPSFRRDVAIEDDLVEEVLRVYGYDRLPSTVPPARGPGRHLDPLREIEERMADLGVASGLSETISYPFVDHASDEAGFTRWIAASGGSNQPLPLANPLDETRRDLRSSLLPGVLDALSRNVRHGARSAGLFEVGRGFGRPGEPDRPESYEDRRFAFAVTGEVRPHWSAATALQQADFYDAKGIFQALVAPWASPEQLRWSAFEDSGFAPGATAVVRTSQGDVLGVVGRVGPSESDRRRLPGAVFAGEVLVEALAREAPRTRFAPFSPYPAIEADVSFSHGNDLTWERIEQFVAELGLAHLERLEIADRYSGPELGESRVKTTLRLRFRSPERTLEQEEVNTERDRLVAALERNLGASF
ncbi:MAG: phenylalanine--tRNA ligase subunit beta [Thermoanaerobaculia bacterium]|nr:phenylalanine--tRNA ligase subunit beta [Thermoanaerobaculia bacterium]